MEGLRMKKQYFSLAYHLGMDKDNEGKVIDTGIV